MGGIQIVNQIKTIAYPKTWDYTKGNHDNQLQNNGNDMGGIQIINQIKTIAYPKTWETTNHLQRNGMKRTIAHLNTWEATKQTKKFKQSYCPPRIMGGEQTYMEMERYH